MKNERCHQRRTRLETRSQTARSLGGTSQGMGGRRERGRESWTRGARSQTRGNDVRSKERLTAKADKPPPKQNPQKRYAMALSQLANYNTSASRHEYCTARIRSGRGGGGGGGIGSAKAANHRRRTRVERVIIRADPSGRTTPTGVNGDDGDRSENCAPRDQRQENDLGIAWTGAIIGTTS